MINGFINPDKLGDRWLSTLFLASIFQKYRTSIIFRSSQRVWVTAKKATSSHDW